MAGLSTRVKLGWGNRSTLRYCGCLKLPAGRLNKQHGVAPLRYRRDLPCKQREMAVAYPVHEDTPQPYRDRKGHEYLNKITFSDFV